MARSTYWEKMYMDGRMTNSVSTQYRGLVLEQVVRKQIEHLFFPTKGLRNVVDYTFINEALSKLLSWLISLVFASTATEYSVGNSSICICFLKMWINSELMGLIKTLWNSCDSFINNYAWG